MQKNKRRRKFIDTVIQKKLLFLIFASAVIPATFVAISLNYLLNIVMKGSVNAPESFGCSFTPGLEKIKFIILIGLPLLYVLIWAISLKISHRIAGPLFRLEKELDERIAGRAQGYIKLREKDELKSLVEKINKLLNK